MDMSIHLVPTKKDRTRWEKKQKWKQESKMKWVAKNTRWLKVLAKSQPIYTKFEWKEAYIDVLCKNLTAAYSVNIGSSFVINTILRGSIFV